MAVFAQSDFEDFPAGFNTGTAGAGTITKSGTQKHGGSYSALVTSDVADYAYALADWGGGVGTRCHVQIYFYMDSGSNCGGLTVFDLSFNYGGGGYAPKVRCLIEAQGGGVQSLVNKRLGNEDYIQGIGTYITWDQWHKVEAYFDTTAGTVAYYVDDVYCGVFQAYNDSPPDLANSLAFGDEITIDGYGKVYFDDLLVDDAEPKDRQGFITVVKKVGPGAV